MQDLLTKFENLTIQSDFIFKKVMSRKRICKHLLEELLQIEIADIKYLEAEKTLEPEYTSRCLLYTSPSPRDAGASRMPSSA